MKWNEVDDDDKNKTKIDGVLRSTESEVNSANPNNQRDNDYNATRRT